MLSRSVRAETRQSRKEDIKRVMHNIDKVRLSSMIQCHRLIVIQVRHWEKRWVVIPETTMKQFKWIPVSQMMKTSKKVEKKRLFNGEGDENSRTSLGMDEDSNMSNMSTASDSLDGPPTMTGVTKTESEKEESNNGQKRTQVTAEGGIYKGDVSEDGKREGRGEYIWPNGDRYVGDFSHDKKNGNGILYFSNGDKRVGVWKGDKLHGQATYYYSGGRIDEEVIR